MDSVGHTTLGHKPLVVVTSNKYFHPFDSIPYSRTTLHRALYFDNIQVFLSSNFAMCHFYIGRG